MSPEHLRTGVPGNPALNILLLSRDDPFILDLDRAGLYCAEIARRLAGRGAKVTLVTARSAGSKAQDSIDGIRIVRTDGRHGLLGPSALYLLKHRHSFDVVVEFSDRPSFLAPLFAPRWTTDVRVINHSRRPPLDLSAGLPLRLAEKWADLAVYRGKPIVVPSRSARSNLREEIGFHNPVYIVPGGNPSPGPAMPSEKTAHPSVVAVGHLVPEEHMGWLIKAAGLLVGTRPYLRVDIVGDGPELPHLRAMAENYGIGTHVTFHGSVGEERRNILLARAWLAVVIGEASLTAIEANSAGTPVVTFDASVPRETGRNVRAERIITAGSNLVSDIDKSLSRLQLREEREQAAQRCRARSAEFSWDRSAEQFVDIILEERRRMLAHRRTRRRPNDCSVSVLFQAVETEATERALRTVVRQTDRWTRAGNDFSIVLNGCDEIRAATVLQRLGPGEATLVLPHNEAQLIPPAGALP
ncbi:glycosyltransferase family 4 protein [Kitasatospora sp. NPDC051914]|uniref:glycosyltransferase family 4 protein n=1 Tax=Kitasatospora sp. NPDC051914 TaxID=3154945 RepID=UPI003435E18C